MKSKTNSLIVDLGVMLFLILTFSSIILIVVDRQYLLFNTIMLSLAFFVVIITYFSTLTMGLVLDMVIIFVYFTVIIYQTIVKGKVVESVNYFWILILPAYTAIVGMVNVSIKKIQDNNIVLAKQNRELTSIDELTGLKNLRAFENDAHIFISISKRYNIPLSLLVIKLRYYNEIEKILEKEKIQRVITRISETIKKTLRTEDNIFILDNQDITWGILLLTDKKGINVVKKRIRASIQNLEISDITHPYPVKIEIKMGSYLCEDTKKENALEMMENAKKTMEYDVE